MSVVEQTQIVLYLLESNVIRVFPEALSADVQTVLADETVAVGAGAAEMIQHTCFKPLLQTLQVMSRRVSKS